MPQASRRRLESHTCWHPIRGNEVLCARAPNAALMRSVLAFSCAVALLAGGGTAAHAQVMLGSGAIVARVRAANGKPLPGVDVRAVGPTTREATTNAAGIAVMSALPPGAYDVSLSRTGYAAYDTRVSVANAAANPQVVAPQMQVASFANLGNAAGVTAVGAGPGLTTSPFVSHAFEKQQSLDVVSSGGLPGFSLGGTLPYESRIELDGIPLAGGSTSLAALRFRDSTGLAGIDIAFAPYIETPTVRDAIGGIVNLRTPSVDDATFAGVAGGYDSAFGSFQHARAVQTFGPVALAFDAVTGGGEDRSQSFKARYALSPGASIDVAAYGLQAAGLVGAANVATSAPAYSAGLRLGIGSGTFDARSFSSSLAVSTALATPFVANENARSNGLQLAYALPLGTDSISFGFDRRGEQTTLGTAPTFDQTFTTFDVRGGFALAQHVRMDLADAFSGGTLVHARNDPAAALSFRASTSLSLRLSAGGAYATAPDTVLAGRAAGAAPLAPETAFGYRLRGDLKLDAKDTLFVSGYRERRFDTFATLANATNAGVGIGASRTPATGLGGLVYVALASNQQGGPTQPLARIPPNLFAFDDVGSTPYSKARAALTFGSVATCQSQIGTTFLGSNNALAGHAVALGDVSLCVPVFGIANVRVGEENVFGVAVADPVLAPLFYPHEVFFSLGLH
jgi:hypothetical protein